MKTQNNVIDYRYRQMEDIADDHPYFVIEDGVLFGKKDARLVYYPTYFTQTEYHIPEWVKTLGAHCFYGTHILKFN